MSCLHLRSAVRQQSVQSRSLVCSANAARMDSDIPLLNDLTRRSVVAAITNAVIAAASCPARAENGPLPKTCIRPSNAASPGVEPTSVTDPSSAAATTATTAVTTTEGWSVVPYRDPMGRFRLARPCGWTQVTTLGPESSVLASFYNAEEPGAETLAVYRAAPPPGIQETSQLGTPQDFAAALAGVAPNGAVEEAYGVDHGGRQYLVAHVQYGGNTAGMFGAAREFRAVTIAEGVQYTLRVTTTRYRYLAHSQVRQLMKAATDSFEVLL